MWGRSRSIGPLLMGALAAVLAAWGQHRMAVTRDPTDGVLLFLLAGVLIGRAVRGWVFPAAWVVPPSVTRRIPWTGLLVLVVSWLSALVALLFFSADPNSRIGWDSYLVGLLLLAVAGLIWCRYSPRAKTSMAVGEGVLLGVVVLLALFVRLYRLDSLPYGVWYDEADNGLWARRILHDPNFRPIYVHSTNLPAHFLHLVAFSFRLFGETPLAIRLVAVFFGVLTVLAGYACGREVFGTRWAGLLLAAFLAFSRWDINWSRIGMHGVTTPFFTLWAAAAFLRGLRTGSQAAFLWAGAATGLGLCFYAPFRLFPVVLLVLLTVVVIYWRGRALGRWLPHAALFLLALLISTAPVLQFALAHPDLFFARTVKVSIFNSPDFQAAPGRTLWNGFVRHLLMFNYQGDPNGRHNLPMAPMLDPVSGVLLVLGLGVALARWRDPRSILLVVWWGIMLCGGIFSVPFEAPQSLRSIGSMPAAYLLATYPLVWFADVWKRTVRRGMGFLRVSAFLLLGIVAVFELHTYFYRQARDFAVWNAFSAAETRLAYEIKEYRDQYDLFFDPLLTNHPTTRFLVPDFDAYTHFDPATVLPLPLPSADKRGIVLFVSPDTRSLIAQIEQWCPGVEKHIFAHPGSGIPVLYTYVFDRSLLEGMHTLSARYTDGLTNVGRSEPDLDVSTDEFPLPLPVDASWSGRLKVERFGVYTMRIEAPDGEVSVRLDGEILMAGHPPLERTVTLAEGIHTLDVEAHVSAHGVVRFLWGEPGESLEPLSQDALISLAWPAHGLLARYFANDAWEGDPVLALIDPQVAHYFHILRLQRPYTVEWSGWIDIAQGGRYVLGVEALSRAEVYVDGRLWVEAEANAYREMPGELQAGRHRLVVRFLDRDDHSHIYLYWIPPDGTKELVPAEVLVPDPGWWP